LFGERQQFAHPVLGHFAMEHSRTPVWSEASAPNYLAHVRRNDDGSFAIHHLEEHLCAVSDLATGVFLSLAVKLQFACVIRRGLITNDARILVKRGPGWAGELGLTGTAVE
jgi:hypothetical protein